MAADPAGGSWRGAGGRRPVATVAAAGPAVGGPGGHRVPWPYGDRLQPGPSPLAAGTGPATAAGGQFPVSLAEPYAAEFGRVYLSLSPQSQGQREQALATFVPASVLAAAPDRGWNGAGQLDLQLEQVAGIKVQDRQQAVVTLLAMVNGQFMELGVPVDASGSGVVVSGQPAWLPAPSQAAPPPAASGRSDPVAQGQLGSELPAFSRPTPAAIVPR
jgi:hypothetical protein